MTRVITSLVNLLERLPTVSASANAHAGMMVVVYGGRRLAIGDLNGS